MLKLFFVLEFRAVVFNPGPWDPLLCPFCMAHLTQITSSRESMNSAESVSDMGDIQNVQSSGSPGPGLKTTGLGLFIFASFFFFFWKPVSVKATSLLILLHVKKTLLVFFFNRTQCDQVQLLLLSWILICIWWTYSKTSHDCEDILL